MSEDYIARKIENCKKLIETASSPEQKKIYRGYLEFWKFNNLKIKVPPEEKIIEAIIPDLGLAQKAAEFENKHFPKKAYYIRDGNTNQTRAFKEFLKSF